MNPPPFDVKPSLNFLLFFKNFIYKVIFKKRINLSNLNEALDFLRSNDRYPLWTMREQGTPFRTNHSEEGNLLQPEYSGPQKS